METTHISDDACERIISGSLETDDQDLMPVRWLVEDLQSLYKESVSRAARALHPSTSAKPAGSQRFGFPATQESNVRGMGPAAN